MKVLAYFAESYCYGLNQVMGLDEDYLMNGSIKCHLDTFYDDYDDKARYPEFGYDSISLSYI